MNFDTWQKEIQACLEETKKNIDYLDFTTHGFQGREDAALLTNLERKLGNPLPDEFKFFYKNWGGLQLINIMNGYHLLKISFILEYFEITPTNHKDFDGKFLVFAANGGGNLFAIEVEQGRVIFLPDPFVTDAIFGTLEPIRVVGYSFNDFLQRLLQDLQAFVSGDEKHIFLDSLSLK